MIVADASFWVAAFLAQDVHHDQSARLLRRMVTDDIRVSSPTLALVEVAGALARAADAVYVALARQEGAPLITLDDEMLKRSAPAILAMTPGEWLRQNPGDRP